MLRKQEAVAMAEMLLALEDSHHGGHLALETLDLDTNLGQRVNLTFPKGWSSFKD